MRKLYDAFFSASDFDTIFGTEVQIVSKGKAIKKTVTPIEKTKAYVRCRLKGVMIVWGVTLVVAASLIWYLRAAPIPAHAAPSASDTTAVVGSPEVPVATKK